MFFFFEFSGMQKMQRIAHGEKMLVLIFKAIKAINPSSISKSDLLASWVRAKTKDTVLILSDIGHYHSANKWKFSPFSSLKISTNPLLFCLHEFPFVLQSRRTVFFFCLLVLGFFFFWNRFFCLLLTEEAEDPISSKSWQPRPGLLFTLIQVLILYKALDGSFLPPVLGSCFRYCCEAVHRLGSM